MKNKFKQVLAVLVLAASTSASAGTIYASITDASAELADVGDFSCADYFEMAIFPAKYVDKIGDPHVGNHSYDLNKSWKFDKNRNKWRKQGVFVPEVFSDLVYMNDSEGGVWNSSNYGEIMNNTNPNPCSIY